MTPLREAFRASPLAVVAACLVILVALFGGEGGNPWIVVYKLSLACVAAYVGYWADRVLFPYGRPHWDADDRFNDTAYGVNVMRRSIVIGVFVVGVCLGL